MELNQILINYMSKLTTLNDEQQQLASYLGMTPESLSRIKKRMKQEHV